MRSRLVSLFVALGTSGCLPLIVGPNNYMPAGELATRPNGVGLSVELANVLAAGMPVDLPAEADKNRWFAQDISGRIGVTDNLAIEGQLKWASTIPTFVPLPIGASLGARMGLLQQAKHGVSMDGAVRLVGVSATQELTNNLGGDGTERTKFKAAGYGAELQLPVSERAFDWLAFTATPFARAYVMQGKTTVNDAATEKGHMTVLGGGLSFSAELKPGGFAIAPAFSMEWLYSPTTKKTTLVSFEPGLALGGRW